MSIKAKKLDESDLRTRKFLPLVQTRDRTLIYNLGFIYQSLLKETSINKSDAWKVI